MTQPTDIQPGQGPVALQAPDATIQQSQDQGNQTAEQKKQLDAQEEARKGLFEWDEAKPRLEVLHSKWINIIHKCNEMRLRRKIDLSPKRLRDEGKLKADETIVPMRNIDTNIKREQPAYINYLVSPPRQYIFKCLDNTNTNTEQLESEVTTGVRFPGWAIPFFKTLDGAQLHGWDAMEIVYDESKPLHVGREQVGHDNLFFNTDSIDLQANDVLVRRYSLSPMQVKSFITRYGFDPDQTDKVLEGFKANGKKDYNITLYKKYFKWEGVVYIAWFSMEYVSDWLKAPQKLRLGIMEQQDVPNPAFAQWQQQQQQQTMAASVQSTTEGSGLQAPSQDEEEPSEEEEEQPEEGVKQPLQEPQLDLGGMAMMQPAPPPTLKGWVDVDIQDYPIFRLPYTEGEEQPLVCTVGRGYLDYPKQEAMTAIASGFVNSLTRSANVYASVESEATSTAAPKQLSTSLSNGAIYDRGVTFFNTPPPEPQIINALQYFETNQSEEAGQIAFAAQNREDSRKTAKEMTIAQQQQNQISTSQVYLWATWLLQMANFEWLIIQSQAMQDKISLLAIPQEQLSMSQPGQMETVLVNNKALLKLRYTLVPAGGVDVQERAEMLQQMKQDWPVFQQTPLASEFMKEYVRRAYPQQSNQWLGLLQQDMDMKQLLMQVTQAAQMLADPAKIASLPPQQKQQLQQLMQQVQQAVSAQTPVNAGQNPVSFGGQQSPPLDSNRLPEQVITQNDASRSEQNR